MPCCDRLWQGTSLQQTRQEDVITIWIDVCVLWCQLRLHRIQIPLTAWCPASWGTCAIADLLLSTKRRKPDTANGNSLGPPNICMGQTWMATHGKPSAQAAIGLYVTTSYGPWQSTCEAQGAWSQRRQAPGDAASCTCCHASCWLDPPAATVSRCNPRSAPGRQSPGS